MVMVILSITHLQCSDGCKRRLGLIDFRASAFSVETSMEYHVDGKFIESFGGKFTSNSLISMEVGRLQASSFSRVGTGDE